MNKQQETQTATTLEALRAFANEIIDTMQLDVDGVQDCAEKHGLLEAAEVTEPCEQEPCYCAEYGDWPQYCYRKTATLKP